ncbi:MAG: hypothetical protein RLZZ384_781, partial [Pseudomonadota bacterium]
TVASAGPDANEIAGTFEIMEYLELTPFADRPAGDLPFGRVTVGDPAIQRLVDRISAIFVPVILAVAAATFLVWWLALGNTFAR